MEGTGNVHVGDSFSRKDQRELFLYKVEVIVGGIFRRSELVGAQFNHVIRRWTNQALHGLSAP